MGGGAPCGPWADRAGWSGLLHLTCPPVYESLGASLVLLRLPGSTAWEGQAMGTPTLATLQWG